MITELVAQNQITINSSHPSLQMILYFGINVNISVIPCFTMNSLALVIIYYKMNFYTSRFSYFSVAPDLHPIYRLATIYSKILLPRYFILFK